MFLTFSVSLLLFVLLVLWEQRVIARRERAERRHTYLGDRWLAQKEREHEERRAR